MENNKEKLELMLLNHDYEGLNSEYNLYEFQSMMIASAFGKVYSVPSLKDKYLNRVLEGYYLVPGEIERMACEYVKNAIIHMKDNGFDLLMNRCNLSENDARVVIDSILKSDRDLKDMLSAELDVSNINIRDNEMLMQILPAFIDSYKNLGLK